MTNSIFLGPWIRRFLLEHLVAERNLALNTQKSYRDMLMQLLPYLAGKANKAIDRLTVDDFSPQAVRLFLSHMEQQRNCTISTRNQRLGGIHALARFIAEHSPEHIGWCAQIRLIPFKKTSQPAIIYLDKPEMDALLAAPDDHTEQGRREQALLLFLYNSGARVSEAVQLKIGDIDWHAQCVRVVGKGNKQRRCPLWTSTLERLHVLVDGREATQPVFLNRCHQPMTRSGIHTLVKRCAARACARAPSLLNKPVSPHVIRHSTACHLLQAGVDINTIRAWLGHVSLTTTNIYAEIDLETKARALAACSVSEGVVARTRWRDQPDLIEFLRTL
ncbi:tyrosine-type recombinase/integrase [Marinobacter sp. ELB17]|jgi:site-specific recombinase XerD|uniref:tyrosine-type recombinase/integrase n=1 Tax=Marinobacter sp. ELB17 TaxID=270374 RepID=UPI0000F375BB|nr:tyrosine-type recombinase/integrase [Marinobacter sp. ELB17]EAZ97102.1 putative integrase/recombinase [Marinobacter sp. ELB17]EBA00640.1 putative integrase/recombinase [Marinobacter sp. ELB17]